MSNGQNDNAGVDLAADERLAHRGPIQQLLTRPEIGAMLGLVGVWLLFWLAAEQFGTAGGTANYLDVAAVIGIMAVPVALLMIGGEFDLSSGSMVGATALLVILLTREVGDLGGAGITAHLAVPLTLCFALGIGWINGTLVQKTSLPSFIVTLGAYFMVRGGKLAFTKLFTDKVIAEDFETAGGFDFWHDIFGAAWIRNGHILESRDIWFTLLLTFAGVAGLAGLFELTFARNKTANPAMVVTCFAGLGGVAAGLIGLHTSDGVGANWFYSILLTVGALVAVFGWCRARYESVGGDLVRSALLLRASQPRAVAVMVAAGVGALVIGIIAAISMNAGPALNEQELNGEARLDLLGGSLGRFVFAAGIGIVGVLAVLVATGKLRDWYPTVGLIIVALPTLSYMLTIQATRAILFGGLAVVGILTFAAVAGRTRPALLIPFAMSIAVVILAFFIRSEAVSRKLRVELFTVLLLIALLIACSALAGALSVRRSAAPPHPALHRWTQVALVLGGVAALVFAVIELADSDGVLYSFSTGVFKGAVVALGVYAVGTVVRMFFSRDDGCGRSLVSIAGVALGAAVTVKVLFVVAEEAAETATTYFRVPILFFILSAALGTWILAKTRFGSWTLAVGGNKDAARSVGVPADRTKTILFMLVAGSAWLAGMLTAFRFTSVQANVGDGNEFIYIIVAVVGGNLLTGGYGSVIGAATGAVIWGMITQGIGFARWNTDWKFVVLGALLLVAVIVNNIVRDRAERIQPSGPADDDSGGDEQPAVQAAPEAEALTEGEQAK